MTNPYHFPFNRIRVARHGPLPYPVNMVLPDQNGRATPAEERNPGSFYIEDVVPKTLDHHTVLGLFVQVWSSVEGQVGLLLARIMEVDLRTGLIVFRSVGMRQAIEMITGFATAKLKDSTIERVVAFTERISQLSSKRNTLIHGIWTLELAVFPWKEKAICKANLLRDIDPTDKRLEPLIRDLRNQKHRVKYAFTLKRISAATRDAITLFRELGLFINEVLGENIELHRRAPEE